VEGQQDWHPEVYCSALCDYYVLYYIISMLLYYIILYYIYCVITKYEYMTCLISCIMIDGN
jgi:hypothetical protein